MIQFIIIFIFIICVFLYLEKNNSDDINLLRLSALSFTNELYGIPDSDDEVNDEYNNKYLDQKKD